MKPAMRISFGIGCAVFLALNRPAFSETMVLQPGSEGKDTYVCDCLPNVNNPNGPITNLYQGQYGICYDRLLIRFDLSSLPRDVVITSAIMELKCAGFYGARSGQMAYYRNTGNWEETKVTCGTLPAYARDDSVLTEWPVSGQWHAVDITRFVQIWYSDSTSNHGIYGHSVRTTGQSTAQFSSSDASPAGSRPRLTITYSPASGVGRSDAAQPLDYRLDQNFPNPFNPTTLITYSIPRSEFVSLAVFGLDGRQAGILADGVQSAGTHEIRFDGSGLPNGIYVTILRAGTFSDVKKMILIK